MLPRLGSKYHIEIQTVSRPRAEFQTPEYAATGLPKAPAIMIGEEVVAQGRVLDEQELEAILRQHLAAAG